MVFELRNQRLLDVDSLNIRIAIVVNTGRAGPHSGKQCGSRWITHGCRAVGVRKGHTHFCESVEIGSFGLAISAKMSHPVVQVVDGDKQDVGPGFLVRMNGRSNTDERKQG